MNYYNENNPTAVQWLRNLISAGELPLGDVDDRSIKDVKASEVRHYTQRHWFAGIGGWSLTLKLAGWPVDRPVDTGSAPCTPFSQAGLGRGFSDERDLWPVLRDLLAELKTPTFFTEQTPRSKPWIERICTDLEAMDYAIGAAVLPAAGAGALHQRYRFYLVADANFKGLQGLHTPSRSEHLQPARQNIPGHKWEANPEILRSRNGISNRLDKPYNYEEAVIGLGNAIVPPLAAEFVRASMEAMCL